MKTMINIKADVEVKEHAQAIARELGLPLSAIVNAFLKEFIRTRSLSVSAVPQMSPALERVLAEIDADIKTGKNLSPQFTSTDDAIAYLNQV